MIGPSGDGSGKAVAPPTALAVGMWVDSLGWGGDREAWLHSRSTYLKGPMQRFVRLRPLSLAAGLVLAVLLPAVLGQTTGAQLVTKVI